MPPSHPRHSTEIGAHGPPSASASAAGWYGGLEVLNRRKFDDQDFAKQGASAFFLGPSLHYEEKEWWATLTVLPQIAGNPASDGSRTLGEYEKMEIRLRFGIDF